MKDNNKQEQSSNTNDEQSHTLETQSNRQDNANADLSNSPLETGQTTDGGEDGNWTLTPEIREQHDSASGDKD